MSQHSKSHKTKNVSIKTNKVEVLSKAAHAGNSRASGRNRRNRRVSQQSGEAVSLPSGIVSNLSGLGRKTRFSFEECSGLSDQSVAFIERACDPCGEHGSTNDSGKVPDGALPTSAGAFFRSLVTLEFPWDTTGTIDLTGKTYSLLVLQAPFFRSMAFVIALEVASEFSDDVMDKFIQSFGNVDIMEKAFYPNWVQIVAGKYWCAVDTSALRNLTPPSTTGVSGMIESYRFSSHGSVIYFNTPDLVNQGTVTSMRYPLNHSTAVFDSPMGALPGFQPLELRATAFRITPIAFNIWMNVSIDGLLVREPLLPSFVGNSGQLPSTAVAAKVPFRNSSNSFTVKKGDLLQYQLGTGTENGVVYLVNTSAATTMRVAVLMSSTVVGISTYGNYRFYTNESEGALLELEEESVTLVTLPPVTQADMIQQNPRADVQLLKEPGGIYTTNSVFQPIYGVTGAGEYGKINFVQKGTDPSSMGAPSLGWFDSADRNFGITVQNLQGIPYACKPFIKISRSLEIVPSAHSLVGAFACGGPAVQTEAVDIVKAFNECQPHGYPAAANLFGNLFESIYRVITAIPDVLRVGGNISKAVKKVCDSEHIGGESITDHFRRTARLAKNQRRGRTF